MANALPWLAFGLDLRLTTTADGGRKSPLGLAAYEALQYRPNWGLPGMEHPDQVGAPVLCFGTTPLLPGARTRAVIIPLVDLSLATWEQVNAGEELRMYEGPKTCGFELVEWKARTLRPIPPDDHKAFETWCRGGVAPPAG